MAAMKLFLIVRERKHIDYDEAAGFVIAAKDGNEVREIAAKECGGSEYKGHWTDAKNSTVTMIAKSSIYTEPTMVLRDFLNG